MRALPGALLDPRRIALIGASGDAARLTARPQRYLRRHGFTGELFPVNPRAAEVLGERAFATLADIPGEIDLAYILLATDAVEAQVEACAARGIPVACVLADGFAEAGAEGAARQARVVAAAQAGGVRLLGPNSMGVVNLHARTALTTNAAFEAESLPAGRVALVSQSGSMIGALLSRGAARGLGFSHLVGTGNEADLTAGEVAGMLLDCPEVDVVCLFLEAIRAPGLLAAAARKAHALGKPIVALKLGRSPFGAELAASHTGALAGTDAAADAFFRAHGILRVTMLEALLELPPLVAGRRAPACTHHAVGVMTTTGGGGALAVDALGMRGIEARRPDAAAAAALAAADLPSGARLLDMTLAGTRPDRVAAALTGCARRRTRTWRSPSSAPPPSSGRRTRWPASSRVAGRQAGRGLPCAAGGHVARPAGEAGIAAFRTPEGAADAIRAFCDWVPPRAGRARAPRHRPCPPRRTRPMHGASSPPSASTAPSPCSRASRPTGCATPPRSRSSRPTSPTRRRWAASRSASRTGRAGARGRRHARPRAQPRRPASASRLPRAARWRAASASSSWASAVTRRSGPWSCSARAG
jgi:acyl-CoA synthetase (NDP forming)